MSVLGRSTFEKMFEAASLCRERALDLPMLVLIYASLDTLAWAVYGHEIKEVGRRFELLCERYVLPKSKIDCTALELYAARCSIVHSLGWESKLSKTGKARAVFYSVGEADARSAYAALNIEQPDKFVAVSADELLSATKMAVARIIQKAEHDSALAARFAIAEGKQYLSLDTKLSEPFFEKFLETAKNSSAAPEVGS